MCFLIKEYRIKRKISQSMLSKITGISQNMISDYENCKSCPSLINALRIANALKCTLDDLVCTLCEVYQDE